LENAIQDGAGRAAGLGRGVGRLDLPENLCLADHLRSRTDDTSRRCCTEARPRSVSPIFFSDSAVAKFCWAQKAAATPFRSTGAAGDAVEFHAIARVQDRVLLDR